ncbi:MAG: TetR/AcrR family transcriptional regulator [Porticoccaceae bacterium]|nr:TetR/AcrR family transcriptional regulator [Porticoccaceae bacterium]
MARPRQFDEEIALTNALDVFRQQGYQGASMSDLTKAMKLSKSSLYETFGSKHDLFIKALKRFHKANAIYNFVDVDSNVDASAKVKRIYELSVASVGSGHGGCIYARCSLEFSNKDELVFKQVAKGVGRLETMFYSIIETGKLNGDVSSTADSTVLSKTFVATFYGLQVMANAGADVSHINSVILHSIGDLK